jgi:hypothetical protein
MRRLTESRQFYAALDVATPFGVVDADAQHQELELLQERHEEASRRDRIRRAESRAVRRYIAEQPKRLVTVDKLTSPGTPYEMFGTLVGGTLPHEWVSEFATHSWPRGVEPIRSPGQPLATRTPARQGRRPAAGLRSEEYGEGP